MISCDQPSLDWLGLTRRSLIIVLVVRRVRAPSCPVIFILCTNKEEPSQTFIPRTALCPAGRGEEQTNQREFRIINHSDIFQLGLELQPKLHSNIAVAVLATPEKIFITFDLFPNIDILTIFTNRKM